MMSSSPNLVTFLRPRPLTAPQHHGGTVSANPTQLCCCFPLPLSSAGQLLPQKSHFLLWLGGGGCAQSPTHFSSKRPSTGWGQVPPAASLSTPKIRTQASVHLPVSVIFTLGKMTGASKNNRNEKYPRVRPANLAYGPKFFTAFVKKHSAGLQCTSLHPHLPNHLLQGQVAFAPPRQPCFPAETQQE